MSVVRKGLFAAVALSGVLSFVVPSLAETIHGAMAKAYQNNSSLNSARAGVRVTDEGVAIAKSGWRPVIGATGSLTYTSSNNSGEVRAGSFGVQIQQSLFDGFQTQNNVRAAESRVRASNESLRNSEQDILFNAAAAYLDVLRDRQIAVFRERNLDFLSEQVRAASSRFEVGEGTRTDVAQAQAQQAAAVAQLSAARAQVQVSEAAYLNFVGDRPGRLEGARPVSKLLPNGIETAIGAGLNEHPAIRATLHLVDAASFVVKATEGSLLPQVNAQAGVSSSFRDTNLPGVGGGAVGDGTTNSASVGLNLTIPIYQGGRVSAQVRQSKESLGQARIEVDVARDSVRRAVTAAWTQYVAAREVVAANRELVSAAQLALSGVIEERDVGQRTTLNVLEAQADVITAQINLASAERDVVAASYAIVSAMGRLSPDRLGLAVENYNPREHYDAVKDKWIGTRTPDGR
ncbi:MAG: TolC family outer membrane protein [Neoaquamicrobium sediminum]|uniref:TolC family outer membrane protein n=1 Tax=Neoaquamicrobium sediminum TaxID=1849104 RepID=UPI001D2B3DDD|nr:TolC family outer membrane protein [Mesorhizobium sediminum]NRC55314.1 TolC family outer membrane protein [Mesorhizobium sediminum]